MPSRVPRTPAVARTFLLAGAVLCAAGSVPSWPTAAHDWIAPRLAAATRTGTDVRLAGSELPAGQDAPAPGQPPQGPGHPPSDAPADNAAPAELVRRVRENLLRDDLLDRQYTYRLHRRSYDVSALGKVSNGPERVFEVIPSPADPERSYRRLVAENGQPLPPEQLRQRDREHERAVLEDKRRREDAAERARRAREGEKARREQIAQMDDAFRVYRIELAGYEEVDGARLLVANLVPRPHVRTETKAGGHMKKFRGRAWVDEAAGQLVRIEMEAIEDVNIGFGILGRLHEGSRGIYRRAPLPNGTWVPVEARFVGTGKTLMLRPFALETWARYTDYRPIGDRAAARDTSSHD